MNGDRLPFPRVVRVAYFSLWLLCLKDSPESLRCVVVVLTLGRQCFLPDGVYCLVQGLQGEGRVLLCRCCWGMPSGICGSAPITCTAALEMAVDISPGAACRLMDKGIVLESS